MDAQERLGAIVTAEQAAQAAGEEAYYLLMQAAEEGDCGCETCVVREVLTAAYPHMLTIARLDESA